jgi:hypothetical protein
VAKKKGKTRPPPPSEPDPEALGEEWRSQMTDECESVPSLVWKRVFRRFALDLSDPKQATAAQVHAVMLPLLGFERVTREMLAELVDRAVPAVFPELKKRKTD